MGLEPGALWLQKHAPRALGMWTWHVACLQPLPCDSLTHTGRHTAVHVSACGASKCYKQKRKQKTQGRGASYVGVWSLIDLTLELSCVHESFIHSFIQLTFCSTALSGTRFLGK